MESLSPRRSRSTENQTLSSSVGNSVFRLNSRYRVCDQKETSTADFAASAASGGTRSVKLASATQRNMLLSHLARKSRCLLLIPSWMDIELTAFEWNR